MSIIIKDSASAKCKLCPLLKDRLTQADGVIKSQTAQLNESSKTIKTLTTKVEELEEHLEGADHEGCEAEKLLKKLQAQLVTVKKERDDLKAQVAELQRNADDRSHVVERIVVDPADHHECQQQMEALEARLLRERAAAELERANFQARERRWEAELDIISDKMQRHLLSCRSAHRRCNNCGECDACSSSSDESPRRRGRSRSRPLRVTSAAQPIYVVPTNSKIQMHGSPSKPPHYSVGRH